MNPKQFLLWGGWILVVLGVVGYLLQDVWAPYWIFTGGENLAHLVLGVVALVVAYWVNNADFQKWLVALVGIVALYFAVHGFLLRDVAYPNYYSLANLENPLDNLLHLVVGVWALWAAFGGKK